MPGYRSHFALAPGVALRRTPELVEVMSERERAWAGRQVLLNQGADRAEAFWRQFGHLAVPALYLTQDGFRLGVWITTLRTKRREGKLRPEQIAALEAIGMLWQRPG